MENLVIEFNNEAVTTSRDVAENFERNHQHVLEAIDNLTVKNSTVKNMFIEDVYTNTRGREYRQVLMNRDGFTLLAMGFTGKRALEFKLKYIEAFNAMENHIKQQTLPINNTKLLLRASLEHEEKIEELSEDVTLLKDSMRIDGVQEFQIKEMGSKRVLESLGGYESNAYNQYARKIYAQFWRDFKKYFMIPRYGELPKAKFEEGLDFIGEWMPDTEMRLLIKQANDQTRLGV